MHSQATYGYINDCGMKNEIILATYLEKSAREKYLFTAPYMYFPFHCSRVEITRWARVHAPLPSGKIVDKTRKAR